MLLNKPSALPTLVGESQSELYSWMVDSLTQCNGDRAQLEELINYLNKAGQVTTK